MQYLIDRELISLMLQKPSESAEVEDYVQKYQVKIAGITDEVVYEYLKNEESMNDEEIKAELVGFAEGKMRQDSPFYNQSLMILIDQAVDSFNKQIYEYYQEKLPAEQKQKINNYIAQVQVEADKGFEEQQKMVNELLDEISDEYKQNGSIASWEEVKGKYQIEQTTKEDEVSKIEQVDGEQIPQRKVEVKLTQSPNIDPVLGI